MEKRDPNVEAYRVLRRFVPEFREFVRGQLVSRYGAERWLDGVPQDVRQRLSEFEKKWGENPWIGTRAGSPLDFSYEEDLIRIVTEEDNWRNVFRSWFGSDKRVIETKLREIRWLRDHVAHFRAVDRDQESKLRALCKEVMLCIARAAKIQADSEAPERFLRPAELLAGRKDAAELLAALRERAAAAQQRGMRALTDEELAAAEKSLLDMIFEQGAHPDESGIEATAIHWRFDEWQRAPETEVLAWQVYAPREPVPRGSTMYLAIRYNPAALRAGLAVKRRASPPFDPDRQLKLIDVELYVKRTGEIRETRLNVDPVDLQSWGYLRRTYEDISEYEVRWLDGSEDGALCARDEFVVRRRRRTTGRKRD